MSYSSDYDARKSRRRTAGCGCALICLLSLIVMAAAELMLGFLGDCGAAQPDCHAASNHTFGRVMLGLLVFNIAVAALLGWWQSRTGKD